MRRKSAALQAAVPAACKERKKESEHADLDADYEFTCAHADKLMR